MKWSRRQQGFIGGAAAVVLVVAFLVGLGINQALFSPSGFVSQYLSALSRHDAASALSMPGVADALSPDTDTTLLRGSGMGELSDLRITQVTGDDKLTLVSASYLVGGEPMTGTFSLTRLGNTFGVFESWAFAEPPLAKITVSVLHDVAFSMGDSGQIDLRSTPSAADTGLWGGSMTFPVFAPGNYVFSHSSKWLAAKDVTVNIGSPGESAEAVIDVQANSAFNERVQKEVNSFLDECVTQVVLQPTGCPFGYQTGNRFVGVPTWEVVEYPTIDVQPGDGTWVVTQAVAKVRITGEVQSLYDGSITALDEVIDAVFSMSISISGDGNLAIVLN